MPIYINTNTMSLNAQTNLANNTNALSKSLEKLASGYKINRAADDAAGLQISETLRAQIRGSKKALENTQAAQNVLSIADGALSVIGDNIQRIRELVVQAANDTNDTAQRTAISNEITQKIAEINRISGATQFNGKMLLDGSQDGANTFVVQVGANGTDEIDLNGAFAAADTATLGLTAASVATNAASQAYLDVVDDALDALNAQRATVGSLANRLDSTAQNLMNGIENMSAAESTIRNVDVASESAEMTRNQILQQASATVLAQANAAPQLALKLLQ